MAEGVFCLSLFDQRRHKGRSFDGQGKAVRGGKGSAIRQEFAAGRCVQGFSAADHWLKKDCRLLPAVSNFV
jgi:hypothetical protein